MKKLITLIAICFVLLSQGCVRYHSEPLDLSLKPIAPQEAQNQFISAFVEYGHKMAQKDSWYGLQVAKDDWNPISEIYTKKPALIGVREDGSFDEFALKGKEKHSRTRIFLFKETDNQYYFIATISRTTNNDISENVKFFKDMKEEDNVTKNIGYHLKLNNLVFMFGKTRSVPPESVDLMRSSTWNDDFREDMNKYGGASSIPAVFDFDSQDEMQKFASIVYHALD